MGGWEGGREGGREVKHKRCNSHGNIINCEMVLLKSNSICNNVTKKVTVTKILELKHTDPAKVFYKFSKYSIAAYPLGLTEISSLAFKSSSVESEMWTWPSTPINAVRCSSVTVT